MLLCVLKSLFFQSIKFFQIIIWQPGCCLQEHSQIQPRSQGLQVQVPQEAFRLQECLQEQIPQKEEALRLRQAPWPPQEGLSIPPLTFTIMIISFSSKSTHPQIFF